MKPASWLDASRHFAKSSLAAVGIVAICVGMLGVLWKAERTDKLIAQSDLEIQSTELAEVRQRLSKFENPGPDPIPPPPPGAKTLTQDLLKDPRYTLFAKDVNITEDKEFQRLLKLPELNADEVNYVDALLNSLVTAAQVWWKIAESEAGESEAAKRIDGQTNDQVSKFLKVWYAQAVTNQSRTITLKHSGVPDDYKTYRYQVSFHDLSENIYVYGNDSEDLFVQTGKTLGLKSGGKQSYTLKWKAGQEIPFWLEYWYGPFYSWRNVVTKESKGALALPLLAKRKWSENGFFLQFDVKSLPGPPIESASFVPGPPSAIDTTAPNGVPFDPRGELN
ncbi:MAG TPA: hypothetical protein DDZ51_18265 [Planctomycetaceae bacterium]|nr:hypothetical protein [Planctomycetaceae bacterium]